MKLPKLKAHENGGLEMTEANGWKQVTGHPDSPNCISLFTYEGSDSEGMSFVIVVTHLNNWATVKILWAECLNENTLTHEVQFNELDDVEQQLDDAVRRLLEWLAAQTK